jgi:O-antigen/teichoic acid export membrane protein
MAIEPEKKKMSLESKIFKGVSWIAFFNVFSQGFSWIVTLTIANILLPGDYGLMAMATIITEYASMFNELGLGAAIIQRPHVTQNELSSVFWFGLGVSMTLACMCFPISYLTAFIMHEPRVIPLTQTIALIFIFSGLTIIPVNLLRRDMNFKTIGFIDMTCIIASCIGMFAIAKLGGGVWTLLSGQIIRTTLKCALYFNAAKWRPSFHFNFQESKSYLTFGIKIALSRSLFYLQERADCFFAGRAWKANVLGLYTFAMQLAQIPTDKITAVVNLVAFPAFSKLQNDANAFNKLFLQISKVTTMVILPLFIGGSILGEELVNLILNPKWYPMIPVFRLLCISQIVTSMVAINSWVHTSQGRPGWNVYYNVASIVLMSISFYFAVQHGLYAIVIPWLTTNLIIGVVWTLVTLKKMGLPLSRYCLNLSKPFLATLLVAMAVESCIKAGHTYYIAGISQPLQIVVISGFVGISCYVLFFWYFDRDFLFSLKKMFARSDK